MSAQDDGLNKNGSYTGFSYGLLTEFNLQKNYALATGLMISYDGGQLEYTKPVTFNSIPDTIFPAGTNIKYRLQYIEIPLSIKLKTNQIGYITYYGQFGLQGGINVRARADLIGIGGDIQESKMEFGKDIALGNLGLLAGAGLEYEMSGNTQFLAGIEFFNGFTDVTVNPQAYQTKSTINHLRLQLGVIF
jgi:Outer membrane protein beta-barrel domain